MDIEKWIISAGNNHNLGIAKFAWKFFLEAHGDECDLSAALDDIISVVAKEQIQQTLDLIRQEIEKVENPNKQELGLYHGFEQARQTILERLK